MGDMGRHGRPISHRLTIYHPANCPVELFEDSSHLQNLIVAAFVDYRLSLAERVIRIDYIVDYPTHFRLGLLKIVKSQIFKQKALPIDMFVDKMIS
jgi:hypothetical protein